MTDRENSLVVGGVVMGNKDTIKELVKQSKPIENDEELADFLSDKNNYKELTVAFQAKAGQFKRRLDFISILLKVSVPVYLDLIKELADTNTDYGTAVRHFYNRGR